MKFKATLALLGAICLIAGCSEDDPGNNVNGTPNSANTNVSTNSSTNSGTNTGTNSGTNTGSNNSTAATVDPNASRDIDNPKVLTLGEQTPEIRFLAGDGNLDDPEQFHYWTFTRTDMGQYTATIEHDAAAGTGAYFQSCIDGLGCPCAGIDMTNCTEESGDINLIFIDSDTTYLIFTRPTVDGTYRITVNGPT